MSRLHFDVLGPLRVTRAGREVELGPARRRAALAALLVDAGRIVPVHTLVDRVWDSRPPANAPSSLQSYVSRLRAVLRDPDAAAGDDPVLVTVAPGYRLDAPGADIDAVRFDDALGAARERRAAGDRRGAHDLLDRALASWRGEPYADLRVGFVDAERVRLRARRDALRELRAQLALDLGDHDRAAEEFTALLVGHPLREPLHAALMLALYRSGRAAEALQHYAAAGERLADELGVDPGPDLRDLHARMLREDPSLTPSIPRAPAVTAVPREVVPPPSAPVAGAMVGRAAELARALAAVTAIWSSGTVGVVALVGEAGIGKSRLAEEIATRVAAEGADVVWSRTWQHGDAPVLWPWVQAVRRIADVVGPETTARALAGRAAPLGALVPDLPGAVDPARAAPDVGTVADVQVQLFEAIAAFLREATTARRVVVVLEDLHWGDAASHRLLQYLVGHTEGVPVAFVVAVRSPADSGRGPDLLASLARSGRTARIDLVGLDAAAVRRYVADRTGAEVDDRTADALVERTGGNPFFVGELAALLAARDTADMGGVSAPVPVPVPTSVRDVVRRRVADLGDEAGQVLATASLMGRTFDLDLLEQVCRLGEDAVDEAVDRATAAGLLGSEPGAPGVHRFTHALVADALAETVGPARRQRLHARTADVLEARLAEGVLGGTGQLVHHLVGTGALDRIERAVELCCDTGARARRRYDLGEAEASLLMAVELSARLAPERADRWELTARTRLGALYMLIDGAHHPDAVAQHRRCEALLRGAGAARDVVVLQEQVWATVMAKGDLTAAAAVVDEMTVTAEAAGDPLVSACAAAGRGEIAMHRGRVHEARTALELACDRLAEAGPVPTEFAVGLPSPPTAWPLWRELARVLLGETDDLPAAVVEQAVATGAADPQLTAFSHGPLAVAACLRDDPAKALASAGVAADLADQVGLSHLRGYYRVMTAWATARLAEREGRPAAGAVAELEAEIAGFDDWPTMLMRPFHLALLADALLATGRPAEAAERLDRAVEETRRTGNAQVLAENHRLRAVAWSRLGRPTVEVTAELAAAAAVAAEQGTVLFGRRIEETAVTLGVQLPSASSAASVRAPVDDITGLVTR